jgi:hypothetical protein
MPSLIVKLVKGEKISQTDLENELHEICDREHSSCNDDCPVYILFRKIPNGIRCPYFKNGHAMLEAIKTLNQAIES